MPGKKDPEYFPLNLNVGLYDFHHGKYESLEEDTMSTDDELSSVTDVLRSRSGSNTSRPCRIRNVSLNMTRNSDDEGEGSMQSSSDLDLDGEEDEEEEEVDMMDTLVLSIREKLRMDSKLCSSLWTAESTPPPTPYDLAHHESGSQSSHSHLRRRRLHPYNPNSSNPLKTRNPLGCIQKKGSKTQYWNNRRGKSNPESPRENPYELLQELLDSGSLIKEAVRRLSNTKRIGCVVTSNTRPTNNNSISTNPMPIPTITTTTALISPNSRFNEDSNLSLSAKFMIPEDKRPSI